MESERPIEKLLRAFAKKRRGEASAPFELRPDVRRRLLKEVARQHDAPAENGGFFRSLKLLFQPNLAFVLVVVALTAITAAMLLPTLSKAKYKSQRTQALVQKKQLELQREMELAQTPAPATASDVPAQPASFANATKIVAGSGTLITNGISGGLVVYGGGVAKTTSAIAGTTASDGLQVFNGNVSTNIAVPFNTSNAIAYNTWAGSASSIEKPTAGEMKLGADARPPTYRLFAGTAASVPKTPRHFRRLGVPQTGTTQTVSPVVLAAFDFNVNGTNVSIRDQDGSVYQGILNPAPAAGLKLEDQMALPVTKDAHYAEVGVANYSFRVEGTNRSLNKALVFSGNLVASTNTPATVTINQGAITEAWPGNFDISGILTIDGKQTPIQAAPVAP